MAEFSAIKYCKNRAIYQLNNKLFHHFGGDNKYGFGFAESGKK